MAAQVALRRQQAREESGARELSLLYGCHEGLLAMHRAGFTFSAAMAHLLSGRSSNGRSSSNTTTTNSNSSVSAGIPSAPSDEHPTEWKRARLSADERLTRSTSPKTDDETYISPTRRRDSDDENNSSDSDQADDRPLQGQPDGHLSESNINSPTSSSPPSAQEPPNSIAKPKPDWGISQEPLDLHHRNGIDDERSRNDMTAFHLNKKKSPLEILSRVFPQENRNILNVVLQRNGGDVLQAIDDILSAKSTVEGNHTETNSNETTPDTSTPPVSPLSPPHLPSPMQSSRDLPGGLPLKASLHKPQVSCTSVPPPSCNPLPSLNANITNPSFASVFSSMSGAPPLTSSSALAIATSTTPFRRPYSSAAHGPRGLLPLPAYPGFFHGISPNFAPGYPTFFSNSMPGSMVAPDENGARKKNERPGNNSVSSSVGSAECWNSSPCEDPSPQDLSSEGERKSPGGFPD